MMALDLRIPAPVLAAVVALAMWLVSSLPPGTAWPDPARTALVTLFVSVGVLFDLLGLLQFVWSRTTINPLHPERATTLVTGGIYRITRNPMYLGLALLLTAWALHLQALWPCLGPVFFVMYIDRFQIRPEEQALRIAFGQNFLNYQARVRRWL